MRTMKYIYTCNHCGVQQEFVSSQDFPMVHFELEPGPKMHLHFCDKDCRDEWLIAHNFEELVEVKE